MGQRGIHTTLNKIYKYDITSAIVQSFLVLLGLFHRSRHVTVGKSMVLCMLVHTGTAYWDTIFYFLLLSLVLRYSKFYIFMFGNVLGQNKTFNVALGSAFSLISNPF